MDKTKYISIQLDEVMEKVLSKEIVVIVDRYNQTFNYSDEFSMAEWFEILKSKNSDNRYDFYYEVKSDEMLS